MIKKVRIPQVLTIRSSPRCQRRTSRAAGRWLASTTLTWGPAVRSSTSARHWVRGWHRGSASSVLTVTWLTSWSPGYFLSPGTMFHQQLKICHWWFYVDCESSEQYYNLDPDITELTIEDFARAGDTERADQPVRYGDNLPDLDYRPRARRGRPLSYGDHRARRVHNKRRSRPPAAPLSRRRIGSRATIIRGNGGNRQRRLPRRRTLKAIPSSSFRTEQSRKRIARQVESAQKKTDELESEHQEKRNFDDEIKMLRGEILKALSFLW